MAFSRRLLILIPDRPPVKTNTRLPSPYSYTVMQNDDDDDICPVCESDCTCNATLAPQQQLPQPPQTTQPLKIRLTLPPKLFSSLQNQKQTTSVAALDGGLAASANTDAIPPLPLPKKRGRPTKLEAEARRLAALRAAEHDNQQQRLTRPRTSRHAGPHIKSSIKKRQQVKTERRKSKKIVYPTSSTDSETEPRTSSFATFSSSFASTSKAAGLESDDSSSLSSLPDPGDESSLEAEEERYVIKQHEERMRMRQERQGGESENRRTSRNSWEQRAHARSASSGLGDRMDEDTDSDSDSEVEGEEEDGDADEEADEADGEGEMDDEEMFATRASVYESDDEEGDADLFFASLSDSDSSINGFDQVFEAPADDDSDDTPVESVVPVDRLDPLALFGHLSKGDLAAVFVKESESHYPFIDSGGFAMGMLDIDFELSVVAQQQRQSSQTGMFATDGIVVDDDEEMWIPTEEDEEEEQSDCGDTTDEDLVSMRGIHTPGGIVLFRVPTPPVSAIDPLSTLSPICKRKKSSAKKHKQFTKSKMSMTHAPKPHDILNKTTSIAHIPTEESPTADDTASVDGASSISWVLKQPVMGQFEKCDPTRQHIIINGENTESIPSPIGQVTRLRRGSGSSRGRKRSIIRVSRLVSAPKDVGLSFRRMALRFRLDPKDRPARLCLLVPALRVWMTSNSTRPAVLHLNP
jgi:hypothetical protein